MLAFQRSLAVLAIGLSLLMSRVAAASTLWFSYTATPTSGPNNPTLNVFTGLNFTLYLWAQMSAGQSFTGLSHDIKMSTPGFVTRAGTPTASYSIQNPNNGLGNRWSSTGTGNAAPAANLLIDNAAASNINGSPMGFASPASNDPTYNAATNSYLVSTLNLVVTGPGPFFVDLFLGVGSGGITWKNSPGGTNLAASTTINFGVGDAAIAGNDSRRSASNANSTLADATIMMLSPEPSSVVMGGFGACAFLAVAVRQRRRQRH